MAWGTRDTAKYMPTAPPTRRTRYEPRRRLTETTSKHRCLQLVESRNMPSMTTPT